MKERSTRIKKENADKEWDTYMRDKRAATTEKCRTKDQNEQSRRLKLAKAKEHE
jgi:hypothetical protein